MTNAHPQHSSPWVIDTRAVGLSHRDGPGLAHPLSIEATGPEHTLAGVLEVPADSPVRLDGRLESVSEGVLLSGQVTAEAVGTCARCLVDIRVPLTAEVRELYAYPDSFTAQTTDADEVPRVDEDVIDLAPLVHDELVLAMPAIPLCRPDCPGLCPQCGERLELVGPDHRHEILDPRWAALTGLLDRADSNPAQSITEEK
ncbi:MAG TPA: YceD family protein [Mycobacteriales bacterium]